MSRLPLRHARRDSRHASWTSSTTSEDFSVLVLASDLGIDGRSFLSPLEREAADEIWHDCSVDLSSNGARLHAVHFSDAGSLSWSEIGYDSDLSLKIYVYDENKIDGLGVLMRGRDGLGVLMRGRDGKISADACVKGQWGTQVKIHRILLESRHRTRIKEEVDLFFVPAY